MSSEAMSHNVATMTSLRTQETVAGLYGCVFGCVKLGVGAVARTAAAYSSDAESMGSKPKKGLKVRTLGAIFGCVKLGLDVLCIGQVIRSVRTDLHTLGLGK